MKKKILITTLVAIVVCIGYFATLAYQDKEGVENEQMVQGEEIGDTEESADEIEETLAPIVEETDEPSGEIVEPNEELSGVLTEQPKTEIPLVETKEPTIKPTVKPTKQAVTKAPTIEPTTKPSVKPTVKPTTKPVKTPTPTKKASKTYWYEVPIKEDGNSGHKYVESELPPEKYPVPDGYEPWRGPDYDYLIGDYIYWTQPLPEDVNNILAYKNDGSPDLKNSIIYDPDEDFLKFVKSSNEVQNYFNSKGVTFIKRFGVENCMSPFDPNDIRSYSFEAEYDFGYNNGFTIFYFDKNYKITEKHPYK